MEDLGLSMRTLVTGHNGYIGCVLVPLLQEAGHEVVGLDNYLFETCTFGADVVDPPALRKDVRDVRSTTSRASTPSFTSPPSRTTRSAT